VGSEFWRGQLHGKSQWGVAVRDTMVITVRDAVGVAVCGAQRDGFPSHDGQTQAPTSPRKNMDLKTDSVSSEQVKWIYLFERLHWTEVCPTSLERSMGTLGLLGIQGQTGVNIAAEDKTTRE